MFDGNKRDFFKWSLLGLATLFFDFTGVGRIVDSFAQTPEQIGLLYSTATGIVLRTINPGMGEQLHLDWLEKNKPVGTALLRIDKSDVGADHKNCPGLDALIPFVKKNNGITLDYGKTCAVVDINNKVVDVILCCPSLYQSKLTTTQALVQKSASIDDVYNPLTDTFTTTKKVIQPII